jgi:signal transduction histidine kinase
MTLGPRSLRVRVTAVASLAVLVVLTVASVGLVTAQRAALVDALDETLDQRADEITARLRAGQAPAARDLGAEDVVVQVVQDEGTVVAASPGLGGDLPRDTDSSPATVRLPGSDQTARLVTADAGGTTVLVAGSLEDVRESTTALAGSLLLAVPLSTAALAGIVWWAVGRALRPVEAIRARVEQITGAESDQRVPEPTAPDEIARLARTMNAMLGRLQRSAERQRRFVADASHELRSPLARIRAELEVDAAHPETADPVTTRASLLTETGRLQRLLDDLLLLARGDAGALDPSCAGPVDLDDVVTRLVTEHRGRQPRIDARGVRPVQVRGDGTQLGRAVANLLDNAVRHARSAITVTLTEDDGRAVLTVADDGPGIPAHERERAFERFTRLDDARSADGGAGLGLAIARDIAERHRGGLVLDTAAPDGARFVFTLPGDGVSGPRLPGRA